MFFFQQRDDAPRGFETGKKDSMKSERLDRRKDMILVSGFNVYPNEVEAVLAGLAA